MYFLNQHALFITLAMTITTMTTATTASTPIQSRDYPTLRRDFNQLQTDETALTTSVNALDGTASKFTSVQNLVNTLTTDLKTTTSDFQTQPSMTNNQCDTLLHGYGQPLEYDTSDTSKAYIAKKPTVVAAGYKNQIVAQLQTLQAGYQTMMNAACVKCPYISTNCAALQQGYYTDWQNAINAYAT